MLNQMTTKQVTQIHSERNRVPPAAIAAAALTHILCVPLRQTMVAPKVPSHSDDHRQTGTECLLHGHDHQMHSHSRTDKILHYHAAGWQLTAKHS